MGRRLQINKFNSNDIDHYWYCEIVLNSNEWPMLDNGCEWMDRPIRQWVYNNCQGNYFFAAAGWIYFELEEDAMMFNMIWATSE